MTEYLAVTPHVTLIEPDPGPLRRIWLAFRTCYSDKTPEELLFSNPSDEEMMDFIERRMETEHRSPLEQLNLQFAISDVSRVFTHQFVRHRAGVSIGQQSGRYTDPIENGVFKYVQSPITPGWRGGRDLWDLYWRNLIEQSLAAYEAAKHLPREDARMLLPQCMATNMTVTINYAALLHMADIRLCTLAQWEFRRVVALMRAEVKRWNPWLAGWLAPKCSSMRQGFCDESKRDYDNCQLSRFRPHSSDMGKQLKSSGSIGDYLEQEASLI